MKRVFGMKQQLWAEQGTIFISVVKWAIYASGLGAIVGASSGLFLWLLEQTIAGVQQVSAAIVLTPLLFVVSKLLIDKLAPDAAGYGTDRLISAIHEKNGKVPFMVAPVKLIASVLTIAAGGSAGKVGPCGQIGASIASKFADVLKIDDTDRKKLVVCGISAGFASVFGTPIGAAIFGVEVLFLGRLLYEMLFPAFVAGITAYHVSGSLGVASLRHPIYLVPPYSEWVLLKSIILGLVCGLVALLFIKVLDCFRLVCAKTRSLVAAPLGGGLLLLLIGGALSPVYLGLGLPTLVACLEGERLPVYAAVVKIISTAVTFAAGGSGGIILPTVWIGAAVGNGFAQMTDASFLAAYSAVGMTALLAGAANTPIAASIIAIELFGAEIAPYAAVACIASYLIVGHHSVFPTQVLVVKKSASLEVATGGPLSAVTDIQVAPHNSVWRKLLQWLKLYFPDKPDS